MTDTPEITPPLSPPTEVAPPLPTPEPPLPQTPPVPPASPAPTPVSLPTRPAKSSPLGPLLIGFFLVVLIAGALGAAYYVTKLRSTPSPAPSVMPSPTPTEEPSATPSATPKSKTKPVSAIKTTASPTATPFSLPSQDLRFGNPSANVKQTIDQGAGDGRVIYREYTSVQAGQFDEVPSAWSPRVTICYHLVADNAISSGSNVKLTFSVDDKVITTDTLSQYDKLEAGRLYDWCHDVTTDIGQHTARLLINSDKSISEANYDDDLASASYENLADNVAPNFSLMGPNNEGTDGTCLFPQYVSDNVTPYTNLKIEQKVDSADWASFGGNRYCFTGSSGESHTFAIRITDARGNASQLSKTFVLY